METKYAMFAELNQIYIDIQRRTSKAAQAYIIAVLKQTKDNKIDFLDSGVRCVFNRYNKIANANVGVIVKSISLAKDEFNCDYISIEYYGDTEGITLYVADRDYIKLAGCVNDYRILSNEY
jgi:hypothetical protein